ncbi:MAG: hypothetical protein R2704_11000 [Microthrixaceae bacterium]
MSLPSGPTGPDGGASPPASLSTEAVLHGGLVTALLCGPLALANWAAQAGRSEPSAGVAAVFSLLILLSAGVGGWRAGSRAPDRPLPNGAAAAAAGYLAVQAVGLVVAAASGGLDLGTVVGVAYLAVLMATCGMIGAAIGHRRAGAAANPGGSS